MNRSDAERLVRKLRAVTVDRGATVPEARVAAEKAAALTARYHLTDPPPVDRDHMRQRRRPARPAPAAGFTGWMGGVPGPGSWSFDVKTGKGSGNVKVHRYHNPSNWRIEIDV